MQGGSVVVCNATSSCRRPISLKVKMARRRANFGVMHAIVSNWDKLV